MKECEKCEYFDGYDYSDGTPQCEVEGGYEACPYNVEGTHKEDNFKIILDIPEIREFIEHTVSNTVVSSTHAVIETTVRRLINEAVQKDIEINAKQMVSSLLYETIEDEIKVYMGKEITVGGGWCEPAKTMTREDYLTDTITKILDKDFQPNKVAEIVKNSCSAAIRERSEAMKKEINNGIKKEFDDTLRKTLSDNVVSMLMSGEAFQRLSSSMGNFLK